MSRRYPLVIFLLLILPTAASAEFEIPEHRWTIGYEGSPTLRRFLGDNWDVSLGGGPNDRRSSVDEIEYQYTSIDTTVPYRSYVEYDKSESGSVHLGVGRRLLREERFWLTATTGVSYRWNNFEDKDRREHMDRDEYRLYRKVGHDMATTVSLGLRAAYDITSRVVFMLNFGVYYTNSRYTADEERSDISDTDWSITTKRYHRSSDTVGTYGYYGIDSISFAFRF